MSLARRFGSKLHLHHQLDQTRAEFLLTELNSGNIHLVESQVENQEETFELHEEHLPSDRMWYLHKLHLEGRESQCNRRVTPKRVYHPAEAVACR